jgi:hypothetical protein
MKYLAMLDRDRPHVRFQQGLRRRIEQTQKVIFSGHISSSTKQAGASALSVTNT